MYFDVQVDVSGDDPISREDFGRIATSIRSRGGELIVVRSDVIVFVAPLHRALGFFLYGVLWFFSSSLPYGGALGVAELQSGCVRARVSMFWFRLVLALLALLLFSVGLMELSHNRMPSATICAVLVPIIGLFYFVARHSLRNAVMRLIQDGVGDRRIDH